MDNRRKGNINREGKSKEGRRAGTAVYHALKMITLSPGTFSLRILRIFCIFVEISACFQLMTLIAAGRFSCGLLSRGMCDTFCLGMVGSVELIILLAE